MIPRLKPRGFWDYGIFALAMTGLLVLLFWVEASNGIGWADGVLAFAAAVLCVFAIILARRREKATWISQPRWYLHLLMGLGALVWMFGAMYADAYILHRRDITSSRLGHDMVLAIGIAAAMLWSSRRRVVRRLPSRPANQ